MIESLILENTVTKQQLQFDQIDSPFILEKVNWGNTSIEVHSYTLPYQIGENYANTSVGIKDITLHGWVVSDSRYTFDNLTENQYYAKEKQRISELKGILNKIIHPTKLYKIFVKDEHNETCFIEVYPSSVPIFGTEEEVNNEVMCKVTLYFTAVSPTFKKAMPKEQALFSFNKKFHFPLVLREKGNVLSSITLTRIVPIHNDGDISVGGLFEIAPLYTSVLNPKIFKVNTSEYIGFAPLTLEVGDTLYIDTRAGHQDAYIKTAEGVKISALNALKRGSKFFMFDSGEFLLGYENVGNVFMKITAQIEEERYTLGTL